MKTKIFIKWGGVLGLLVASFFLAKGTALADSKIYISQVQITGGTGKTDNDFVEFFNPNDQAFDLKGYRLVKRTANGTSDTSIKSWTSDIYVPAKGYFLWANSNFVSIPVTPDATTTGTLSNDNGVAIRQGASDTGLIIDSVSWGTTNNTFRNVSSINPGAGQTLLRQDLYNDNSAFSLGGGNPHNAGAAAFVGPLGASVQAVPAIGAIYSSQSSDIHITEILPNPVGEDSGQEAVELQNDGGTPVDLEGWIISDKAVSSGVNVNAYIIHGQSILSGAREIIIIPAGYFILANSGGDTVNLYFPDKTLADSVTYSDDAPEGQSYQKINNAWVWAPPSLGDANFADTQNLAKAYQIYINEIMVDPQGADEGNEWVELGNAGDKNADLNGFMLDFGGDPQNPTANALTLDQTAMVLAKGFLVLHIPEENFELLNSGGMVKLFDTSGNLIDRINYPVAQEGLSYSKVGQAWQYVAPTPGQENSPEEIQRGLIISEIYPNPAPGQEEFLELQNTGKEPADLKNWTLKIGGHIQNLKADIIGVGEFYVISQSDLTARLRNDGENLQLVDPAGNVADQISYSAAPAGQAYARYGDSSWAWSAPSPGEPNPTILGAVVDSQDLPVQAAAKTKTSKILAPAISKAEQDLQNQVEQLTSAVNNLKDQLAQSAVAQADAAGTNQSAPSQSPGQFSGLALALAALALLIVVVRAFLPNKNQKKL